MRSHRSNKERIATLSQVPSFAAMSGDVLADLDAHAVEAVMPAGRTLCGQGSHPREAYVLISGSAAVTHDGRLVATYGPGDLVNALALLDGLPSPEAVVALTDVTMLVLSPSEFSVFFDHAELASRFARSLAARARLAYHDRFEAPVVSPAMEQALAS